MRGVVETWKEVPRDEITKEMIEDAGKGTQVLAYSGGSYFNAWLEFDEREGGWFWMDEADSEPIPTHYRALPIVPGIRSKGGE